MRRKGHKQLQVLATRVRRHIIAMSYKSQSGEIGSALCIADILVALYFNILDIKPKHPLWHARDRFILSKGHGAAALYATLALRGYYPEADLTSYRMNGGRFHCHPCQEAAPGIEVSTGSLGHGLSIAVGMALGMQKKYPGKKVFTLIGDGECNEGSVWEAAMFASKHKLSNIVVIVDNNKFQGFGAVKDVLTTDLQRMWKASGWDVLRMNGHDIADIESVLLRTQNELSRPTVIIADTISGKGIPEIENTLGAHYFIADEKTYLASRPHDHAT